RGGGVFGGRGWGGGGGGGGGGGRHGGGDALDGSDDAHIDKGGLDRDAPRPAADVDVRRADEPIGEARRGADKDGQQGEDRRVSHRVVSSKSSSVNGLSLCPGAADARSAADAWRSSWPPAARRRSPRPGAPAACGPRRDRSRRPAPSSRQRRRPRVPVRASSPDAATC